jgi:hypothetical protein
VDLLYRHAAQLILRRKGRPGYTLLSSEGVTQGDPLSMVLYGLALVPLAKKLWQEHPEVVQAWYADDGLLKGYTSQVAAAMTLLQRLGPERGYLPEPAKSIFICSRRGATLSVSFKFTDGYRYIGGFLGRDAAISQWLAPQIQQWVLGYGDRTNRRGGQRSKYRDNRRGRSVVRAKGGSSNSTKASRWRAGVVTLYDRPGTKSCTGRAGGDESLVVG